MVVEHPLGDEGAAAGDDAGDPLGGQGQVLQQDTGVDRLVVGALLGMMLHHLHEVVRGEVFHAVNLGHDLVDGHGADGDGCVIDDRLADAVDVAAGGEVHDGIGAVVDGGVELLQLLVDVGGDGGVADVGVDLDGAGLADADDIQPAGEVTDVGGDNHATAGHFVAHDFRRKVFPLGDTAHGVGDDALLGVMDLRDWLAAAAAHITASFLQRGLSHLAARAPARVNKLKRPDLIGAPGCFPFAGITQIRFRRSAAAPAALSARGHELPLRYSLQTQRNSPREERQPQEM